MVSYAHVPGTLEYIALGKFTFAGKRDHEGRVSDIRRRTEEDKDIRQKRTTISATTWAITIYIW